MKTVRTEKKSSGSRTIRCFLLSLLMLALPLAMHAQQYSGTITGTVTDSTGASVTATSPSTGASYNTTTSDQGVYVFAQLPVGMYQITIKRASFKEFVAK